MDLLIIPTVRMYVFSLEKALEELCNSCDVVEVFSLIYLERDG